MEEHIVSETCPVYQHSDLIFSRRKALFPSLNDDNSSDLGPMSPLSCTNSNASDSFACKNSDVKFNNFKEYFATFRTNINNYVIIEGDSKDCTELVDVDCENRVSINSPMNLQLSSPDYTRSTIFESPTQSLKTPHDTSSVNVKVPKLVRKNNGEFLHDIEIGKHNFSPPYFASSKLDSGSTNKASKIRTALFPDISLPVQSFYSKSGEKKMNKTSISVPVKEEKEIKKSAVSYLCNRKTKRRYGQINAGVRHKIRKPKQKVPTKINPKKAVMSVTESAHLVEFINEMNILKTQKVPKLITAIKCNEDVSQGAITKRNIPEENSKRKFFKVNEDKSTTPIANPKVDVLDFANEVEQDILVPNLDKILDTLDEENLFPPNQIVLKASNKIIESDNSILFHHAHENTKYTNCKERKRKLDDKENESVELLLSPTSQMCDMTSGLALNSPKRAKLNITNIIDNDGGAYGNVFNKMSLSSASDSEKEKLFPIFYSGNNQKVDVKLGNGGKIGGSVKKWKNLPPGQMLLDAGQSKFGFTQCAECELVYHMGDPSEEIMHSKYHESRNVFSFKGWKNENVVGSINNSRIIKISPGDSKIWLKKVKDLIEIINRDLGYYDMELNIDNSCVFLYIKNKAIAGCIIAEPKPEAFKMLLSYEGIDVCSKDSFPIKCGISRIWVPQPHRKQGIATAMMECVRMNFCYGYVLNRNEIALSSPSELGKCFAKKYFQTDNFLIYTS